LKPLSWYKALADARKRREEGRFLVEGRRAIEQIKTAAPESIEELLVTDTLLDEYRKQSCQVRGLTERQFKTVCTSKTPQGAAAVVKTPEKSYSDELPSQTGNRILLLEGVQDPGNVGTLVRTAAAFDYSGVVLSESCADPFSPKAVQASAGSILSVWVRRTDRYLEMVRGEPLTPAYRLPIPCALMLGSEGKGLSENLLALADKRIRIPMNDRKAESLNVAVAGAIMMYCARAL
jgi:TrmH family RNA methyltransferase